MAVKKKKISELPLAQSLVGLFTIGVDALNKSVKVGLEFVKTAADNATAAATSANNAASSATTAATVADTATATANTAAENAVEATAAANTAAEAANTAAATAQAAADTIEERLEGVTTSSPIIIDLDSLMGAIDDTMSNEMWRIVQEVQKDRNRSIIAHSGSDMSPAVMTSCAVIFSGKDVTICVSNLTTTLEDFTELGLPKTLYASCSFRGKYDENHVYDIVRGVDSGNLNKPNTVGMDHSILTEQIVPDEFWLVNGVRKQVYVRTFTGTTPGYAGGTYISSLPIYGQIQIISGAITVIEGGTTLMIPINLTGSQWHTETYVDNNTIGMATVSGATRVWGKPYSVTIKYTKI